MTRLARRDFLRATASLGAAAMALPLAGAADDAAAKKRPRITAINSIYRLHSHAYHIASRFIFGYPSTASTTSRRFKSCGCSTTSTRKTIWGSTSASTASNSGKRRPRHWAAKGADVDGVLADHRARGLPDERARSGSLPPFRAV